MVERNKTYNLKDLFYKYKILRRENLGNHKRFSKEYTRVNSNYNVRKHMDFIKALFELYLEKKDFFIELVFQHLYLSFLAVVIAAVIGITLGIFISERKKVSTPVMAIINFVYTIPSIAILGFLVSLSGIGNITAVITLSIYGLLPMVTSTYTGLKNIDIDILESAESMGVTKNQMLWKVKFPMALGVIFSGFRNMVVMTIALCGIASFIGAGGLGVAIWRGITTNNSAMTCAGSLLIAILALIIDFILSKIEKRLNFRYKIESSKKKYKKRTSIICITVTLLVMIILGVLVFKQNKNEEIVIASKPMTEQYVLTEVISQLIEDRSDIKVTIKKGIGGGTANIHPAIVKGDIDLYPEYTGTSWEYVLKNKNIDDDDKLYEELKRQYEEKYNLTWSGLYGYNSTYAIVVNKEIADKYNIKTYSDLAKVSENLTLGAEYDFYERDDGYDAIAKVYGYSFKNTLDIDMGLKYEALKSQKVDVIMASSTDAQLNNKNFVVLEDDKHFFSNYFAGTIVRKDTLEEYPELNSILDLLNNNISEKDIIAMNYEVEVNKKDDKDVAREFLIKKGLIE